MFYLRKAAGEFSSLAACIPCQLPLLCFNHTTYSFYAPRDHRSMGSMTSVEEMFYNDQWETHICFSPCIDMLPFITCLLIENIKQWRSRRKCDALMLHAWCLISVCYCWGDLSCARGQRAAFSRDVGAKEGTTFWAVFFFFCPENRPWFPGTMQLMRVPPRKIRLWHHGFLKHTAEPTLSPAIIKPQWISTVDWNWERGRISSNGLD